MNVTVSKHVEASAQIYFGADAPEVELSPGTYEPMVLRVIWTSFSENARWELVAHLKGTSPWHVTKLTPFDFKPGEPPAWIADLVAEHTPDLNVWKES